MNHSHLVGLNGTIGLQHGVYHNQRRIRHHSHAADVLEDGVCSRGECQGLGALHHGKSEAVSGCTGN